MSRMRHLLALVVGASLTASCGVSFQPAAQQPMKSDGGEGSPAGGTDRPESPY